MEVNARLLTDEDYNYPVLTESELKEEDKMRQTIEKLWKMVERD